MAVGNLHMSIITLNVNLLKSQVRKHRVADWIKTNKTKQNKTKQNKNPSRMLPSSDAAQLKDKYKLKAKGSKTILKANGIQRQLYLDETDFKIKKGNKRQKWKMILKANGIQREAGIAILMSDEIEFEIKKVRREKYEHYNYKADHTLR